MTRFRFTLALRTNEDHRKTTTVSAKNLPAAKDYVKALHPECRILRLVSRVQKGV